MQSNKGPSQCHRVLRLGWPFKLLILASWPLMPRPPVTASSWPWTRWLPSVKVIRLGGWHLGDVCWQYFQQLGVYVLIPEGRSGWHIRASTKVHHTLDWVQCLLGAGATWWQKNIRYGCAEKEMRGRKSAPKATWLKRAGEGTFAGSWALSKGYTTPASFTASQCFPESTLVLASN